jgi:hypothetical protein
MDNIHPVTVTDEIDKRHWRLNGYSHRTDGPAIEWHDGGKEWWLDGERHRTDGPAIEYITGYEAWWVFNELHRTDGPAVGLSNGNKQWWLHHELLPFDAWLDRTPGLTDEEKVMYKLEHG